MKEVKKQLDLHTRLFRNVVEGLEEEKDRRPNEFTNHIAWLAGHLVSTRYMLANLMGAGLAEPFPGQFEHGKGIDPNGVYPYISEQLAGWEEATNALNSNWPDFESSDLTVELPQATPLGKDKASFTTFILHHEAYHLGQLGILRRYYGKEAMKYS